MNDVKINGVDFANRQGSAASSNPPRTLDQQENTSGPESTSSPAVSESAPVGQSASVGENTSTAPSPNVEAQEQSQERVENAVTALNDYVQSTQRDLQFQLDDDSGRTVVTVIDRQTEEVVRQIPDELALKLAQDLQQDEPLSLFSARV